MLEVGSYTGMFLKIARQRGFDVLGVEPSVWASSYARETMGIPTVTGSVESIPADKPFDVVCSWDVLEHVADPMEQLKQINQRLFPAEFTPSPRSTTGTGTRDSWASAGPG